MRLYGRHLKGVAMDRIDSATLIAAARKVAGGSIAAAALIETGDIFTGICIDARSSLPS